MGNLWYDLSQAIISAILGALFGVLIPKLLKDKKISDIHVDKQLIFSQIHIEQKQYIVNTVESQRKNSNNANKSQSVSTGEIIILWLVVAVLLPLLPVRHLFLQLRFYFHSLPGPELQLYTLQVLLFSSFFIPHFSNIY